MEASGALRAEDLAQLVRTQMFDLDDAAAFLGLDRSGIWAACYRRRIRFVQYGRHKYFAIDDLRSYAAARNRGLASELVRERPLEVVTEGLRRVVRPMPWPEDIWP